MVRCLSWNTSIVAGGASGDRAAGAPVRRTAFRRAAGWQGGPDRPAGGDGQPLPEVARQRTGEVAIDDGHEVHHLPGLLELARGLERQDPAHAEAEQAVGAPRAGAGGSPPHTSARSRARGGRPPARARGRGRRRPGRAWRAPARWLRMVDAVQAELGRTVARTVAQRDDDRLFRIVRLTEVNTVRSASSVPNSFSTRARSLIASTEVPPRAKKSWSTPTGVTPSTSLQISAIRASSTLRPGDAARSRAR
jgi:hypothetical protein